MYQEVVVSLAEAATKAEVSLWEMMEYIHLKNIRPPVENPEEIEKELLESMN